MLVRFSTLIAALALAARALAGESALDEGRKLFTQGAAPPCGMCHTLKAAGAAGAIGPNLDELKPDEQRVARAVKNGIGLMPPYATLSDRELQALAQYVSKAAAGK